MRLAASALALVREAVVQAALSHLVRATPAVAQVATSPSQLVQRLRAAVPEVPSIYRAVPVPRRSAVLFVLPVV